MNSRNIVEPRWFQVAVHGLVVIARSSDACPSAAIARAVQAHAVYLRRVLAQLVRVGILAAQEGRAGGYRLARSPDNVTLGEVYLAVKLAGPPEESALADYDRACVQSVLADISDEVEQALVAVLSRHSLAEVMARAAALHERASGMVEQRTP